MSNRYESTVNHVSGSPDIPEPETGPEKTHLIDILLWRARHTPRDLAFAFLDNGETESLRFDYGQLAGRVRSIAAALQSRWLPGDRVILLYPPGLEYICAFLGCLAAGLVAVPAYPPARRQLQRLNAIVRDADPIGVLSNAEIHGRFEGAQDLPEFLALDRLITDTAELPDPGQWNPPEIQSSDLAFLQYTSGSTGSPKGVMISHANLMANQSAIKSAFGHDRGSAVVGWLPLYHDMGLIGNVLQPLYCGAAAMLMPPMAFFEQPIRWLRAIHHYRAHSSGGPDFAYDLCVRSIRPEQTAGLDLSCWKVAFNGSEPIRARTLERFNAAFAANHFQPRAWLPCYGLAESTLFVSGTRKPEPPVTTRFDAEALARSYARTAEGPESKPLVGCGRVESPRDVQIVDPDRLLPVSEHRVGEICLSGPSVAPGYWANDKATRATFGLRLNDTNETGWLRTGDLGFIHNNQLYVCGRLKDLIIIRGRNLYPQDIESAVQTEVAEVRPGGVAAFAIEGPDGEKLVVVAELQRVALKRASDGPIQAAIRRVLAEIFETEVQLVLLRPGAIPKTSSGKLRRSTCKQMLLDGSLDDFLAEHRQTDKEHPVSSRTATPEAGQQSIIRLQNALSILEPGQREPLIRSYLATCLARLLELPETAIDLDLSPRSLGIASLQALELKHAADRLIASDLSLPDWLGDNSLTVLAQRLARRNPASFESPASDPRLPGPLSETQKAIWAVHRHDLTGTAYNLHFACRFQEALDPRRFLRALEKVLRNHPILRTVYREDADGQVHQIAEETAHPDAVCRFIEALDWSETEVQQDFARRIHDAFDLEHGPVFQVYFYPRATGQTVMLATGHHIAFDFWSLSLLLRDLERVYVREAGGGNPPAPSRAGYREFVEWQKNYLESSRAEKAWTYWSRQLGGDLSLLDLRSDFPATSTPSHHGASAALRLDRNLSDALNRLAVRRKVSLFTLLLGAYKVLLFRHSGQADLIVGVPFHGRGESRFAEVIGNFVNPLALRTRPRAGQPFSEYLEAVATCFHEALEHADFPFPVLVERLRPVREAGRWPIYQTWFVLQQTPSQMACGQAHLALAEDGGIWRLGAWQIESLSIRQRIENFDLKLMAAQNAEGLLFSFQYRQERFRRESVERLASRFQRLLQDIVKQEHCVLGDLEWLDPIERQQLQRWNATRVAYPFEGWVHQHVERRAERTPEATALVFGEQRLSYAQLNAQANRIAHGLLASGVRADSVVAVCARRSLELVPALHGILKAGAAYLPLDPQLPEERLRGMLEEARPACLLLQTGLETRLSSETIPALMLDAGLSAFADCPRYNPDTRIHGAQAAYVIYTSGSTGRPKGVMVPHQGLLNRLVWMQNVFQLRSGDCILQKTPYAFDVSVWEFFWPLMAGAKLVVEQPDAHRDPQRLIASIEACRITCLHFVPSMLRAFLEAPGLKRCSSLRLIISSGEALDTELAALAAERLPAELYNLYGPTEASIDVTFWNYRKGSPDAQVPIGRPIANTRIYLLDARLHPVPPGSTGEIYIGGIGLARGYIARPRLSAERFLPDPYSEEPGQRMYRTGDLARQRPDGAIEYLGRNDFQVKIRGYRIELGEIEACLSRHPAIASALVQAFGLPGEQRLIAYAIPAAEPPDIEALRGYLKESLADYMIPAAFVFLDRWPLSANGKLDRGRLPAPDLAAAADTYVAPRNPVEHILTGIWNAILRIEGIGVHDNFFSLGGDSILSIQVAGRAHSHGLRFAPKDVFQYQTIAALAPHVEIIEAGEPGPDIGAAEIPSGPIPLTPIQTWFFQREWVNPHHWNQALLLRPDPELDPEGLASALRRVLDRHPVFRLRFRRNHGEWQAFSLDSAEGAIAVAREDLSRTEAASIRARCEGRRVRRAHAVNATSIRARCEAWQCRLHLEHGPLLNAVWFDLGPNQGPRLLLIAHHLVVDAVSWTILLDDLQRTWRNGPEATLAPAGSAYQIWSLRLAQPSEDLESPAVEPCRGEEFPVDDPHGSFLESDTEAQRFELNAERSQFLLQQAPRLLHAGVQEILLAALFEVIARQSGIGHLEIDVESHGREHPFPDIDLSRSIGWFTRLIKVRVSGKGPEGALRRIKQQVRPRLTGFKAQTDRSFSPNAPILFNYLGRLELPGHLGFVLDESPGNPRDPRNPRSHEWEINAAFHGGRLRLDWNYSRARYQSTGIQALGQALIEGLDQILRSASQEGPTCLAPSDFPLAGLDPEELDAVALPSGEIEDIYPLGAMQEGLLFHTLARPGSGIYVMQDRYQLEGGIDESLFTAAWQRVVEDHAILRSGFHWDSGRQVLHLVRRAANLRCEILDWRDCSEQRQSQRLQRMLEQELKQGFDLSRPPLLRIRLLRLTQTRYCLVRSFHHIIMDAWCTSLLLEAFMTHYLALRSGAPRPACCAPAFRDYIAWLKSRDHAAAEHFWENYLAGFSEPTPIGFVSRRGPGSIRAFGPESRVADQFVLLSEAESDFLQSRAQTAGLTLNTLVQAAWALLLRTCSGRREVLYGITVAGRPTDLTGIERTLGLFINSLPLRIDLRPEQTIESWLHALQEQNLHLRQYEFTPLSRIQALSGIPRGQALFDSLLVFENTPIDPALRDGSLGLAVVGAESRTHTNYPLTVVIIPDRRLCLQITYQVDRYESGEITRMLEQFKYGLLKILEQPEARLAELDLLPAPERDRWLKEWNRHPAGSETVEDVIDRFHGQVRRSPDRIAASCGEQTLSYAELDARAEGLAQGLAMLGIGPESLVALLDERGIDLLIAILAVFKAGAAYLPLDPQNPDARLQEILLSSGCAMLLAGAGSTARMKICYETAPQPLPPLHPFQELLEKAVPRKHPRPAAQPNHLAYVIFTSGSSGRPKGAMVERAGMNNNLLSKIPALQLSPEDVIAQTASQSFDISVWQFLSALAVGARVAILPDRIAKDPLALLKALGQGSITVLESVPSMIRALLDTLEANPLELPALRWLLPTGEAFPPDLCRRWMQRFPHVSLLNAYGPAECSDDVAYHRITTPPAESNHPISMPIGRPVANLRLVLLDTWLNPVSAGITGEICVAGRGVGRGYLKRPALTAERFIPDPFAEQPGERLYRSGDLAFMNPAGELVFIGRTDHQVKLHGFRIELGEIEASLCGHPDVAQAAVLLREDRPGEQRLVAYLVPARPDFNPDQALPDLRSDLQQRLPEYMLPSATIVLESLPLSPNGKLDRKRLPEPGPESLSRNRYTPPSTATETRLVEIWSAVLRVDSIGIHDNFFELGGDSILSIQIVSRARQTGLELNPRDLFQYPTISRLAEYAESIASSSKAETVAEPNPILRDPKFPLARLPAETLADLVALHPDLEDVYPLTPMQEGMLFHTLLKPGSGIYHMQDRYRVSGPMDVEVFRQAWQHVVDQNPVLRSGFYWGQAESRARQMVFRDVPVRFETLDWRDLDPNRQEQRLEQLLLEELRQGFDLREPSLLRLRLIRLSGDTFYFTRSYHHILMDAWCLSLLMVAVLNDYQAVLVEGHSRMPTTRPYRDYIEWLGRQDLKAAEIFWRSYLHGFKEATPLLPDGADLAPAHSGGVDDCLLRLSRTDTLALRERAKQLSITPNTLVQAAWALCIAHLSDRDDVAFGVTVSGRTPELPGCEEVVGLFINTLALRVRIVPNLAVSTWLQQLFQNNLQLRQYEYSPLVEVQGWSEVPRDQALFHSLLVFENAPIDPTLHSENLRFTILGRQDRVHTNYPLTLEILPEDELSLRLTYDRALFDPEPAADLLGRFRFLLEQIIRVPEGRVGNFRLWSDQERHDWLEHWKATALELPLEQGYAELFERQVARDPDAVAAECEDRQLCYTELNERANAVARALLEHGQGPESVVAVALPRDLEWLIALIGIFKAGAAYLPLDPNHPPARLAEIVRISRPALIVGDLMNRDSLQSALADLCAPPSVLTIEQALQSRTGSNPRPSGTGRHLAYIIHTSGSTGSPKGAMVERAGMLNNILNKIPELGLTAEDRIAQTASQCFDISIWQLLAAPLAGARVSIFPDRIARDPQALLQAVAERRISILESVPSLIQGFLECRIRPDLPHLRWLIPTGEALAPEVCRAWMLAYPKVALLNAYGPAECSDDVAYYRIPRIPVAGEHSIPIGRPSANNRLYVLNRFLEPLPPGAMGELVVAGVGVGRGYLNDPRRSAGVFLPDPFSDQAGARMYRTGDRARLRRDGQLEFLGRIDAQVKLRGYRIELGEIEARLTRHERVRQAAVLVREDAPGDRRLVAYLVTEDDWDVAQAMVELRGHLRRQLPEYMLPAAFVLLKQLPLNSNGKLDLKALPPPDPEAFATGDYVAPGTPTETVIAGIWAEVLRLERVGARDNFFDLGGHSLLVTQIIARVQAAFAIDLPLSALFETGSVESMARVVDTARWAAAQSTAADPAGDYEDIAL